MQTSTPTPTCPFCQTAVFDADVKLVCPSCSSINHQDCWNEAGGCAVVGCASAKADTSNIEGKSAKKIIIDFYEEYNPITLWQDHRSLAIGLLVGLVAAIGGVGAAIGITSEDVKPISTTPVNPLAR
jgi:hypothetical protein